MAKKKTAFGKETYLKWYEDMLFYRKFEEKCGQLYIQQKIKGFCHLYIGQEAVVAGSSEVLQKGDNVITAYRDHVHPIAMGVPAKEVLAELYGKATGCVKGRGGSMHMFSKEKKFWGGHGIVGGQIPLGAGIAFAEKYRGTKNVTLCYMGDGAVRQGAFHEALNMAMTWKLPVIFIIENNHYAMGTSVERTSNVTDLYKLGHAFEMPSEPVNGMDPVAVHDSVKVAADRARNGDGPTLLEINTYRYKGHSMSDPAKYRTKQEVEEYKSQDPIQQVLAEIKKKKYASDEELEKIGKSIAVRVQECVDFAEESPFPDGKELYDDVYAQKDYPFIMD
jgi:pyruvate dehydrogenase E1 component alpha subunit